MLSETYMANSGSCKGKHRFDLQCAAMTTAMYAHSHSANDYIVSSSASSLCAQQEFSARRTCESCPLLLGEETTHVHVEGHRDLSLSRNRCSGTSRGRRMSSARRRSRTWPSQTCHHAPRCFCTCPRPCKITAHGWCKRGRRERGRQESHSQEDESMLKHGGGIQISVQPGHARCPLMVSFRSSPLPGGSPWPPLPRTGSMAASAQLPGPSSRGVGAKPQATGKP